jgi:hypothetical protein
MQKPAVFAPCISKSHDLMRVNVPDWMLRVWQGGGDISTKPVGLSGSIAGLQKNVDFPVKLQDKVCTSRRLACAALAWLVIAGIAGHCWSLHGRTS